MQHAISGTLPSSAVMFLDLPWFSDSKLPFPSLFGLVQCFISISVFSLFYDIGPSCSVSVCCSLFPSTSIMTCLGLFWMEKKNILACIHVGCGARWPFNVQLYNRRRFSCQGITEWCAFLRDCGRSSGPAPCLDLVIGWPWGFASANKCSALFLVGLFHALVSFTLCRLK